MDETSARLGLPLLAAGQAQKEITHNEALALLDMIVQAAVEAVGIDDPPLAPSVGEAWIVGSTPTGAWQGRAKAIAGWTTGGWRFIDAIEGMAVWSRADGVVARLVGDVWTVATPASAIGAPAGGAVIDAEARAAISAILAALRQHHVIASPSI